MTDPETEWRYGMYLEEFGGPGGTARAFSLEGCINMLRHDMERMHHASELCTCGQYPKDRLKRPKDPKKWCTPCRELKAAQDQLETQTEVHYLRRVWYYREEPSNGR